VAVKKSMNGTGKEATQFKAGNPGRAKGSKNKRTVAVAEALQSAFDGIGGVDALIKYAKTDTEGFYKLWVKMLPQQIKADISMNAPLIEIIQEGRRRASHKQS
jgi:hypothetical protein|tara:strand:- start:4643 stop:4951 length:309 start_codon:yes stop_codon:yes gene_type:complete